MWSCLTTIIIFSCCVRVKCQFHECHDDPEESPESGPIAEPKFAWLGALQYIHVKNGTPHYFRVPRLVLISRQFVLCTAVDAAEIPKDYALGNAAFADYERDEGECGITTERVIDGEQCDPAILLVPIADVLIHPEYKHFKAKNSLALLKLIRPIKSVYMLPACLPFKNYLIDERGKQTREKIIHIDFTVDVPRDFSEEEKEVKRISLLPKELCYMFDPKLPENSTMVTRNRMMCTTGCGFHAGAPTLVHEHTGHWSLVSLATGYVMPRTANDKGFGNHWLGHWFMGGVRCFDRGTKADDMFKFYREIFSINPGESTRAYTSYNLEIHTDPLTAIVCIKVGMPYRFTRPRVKGLNQVSATVTVPLLLVHHQYRFQIEAWAYNTSSSSQTEQDFYDASGYR